MRAARAGWPTRCSELGFELDEDSLAASAAEGKSIGRPHLARAAVSHPANQTRLEARGPHRPLGVPGRVPDRGQARVSLADDPVGAESIDAIHEAGGVAIWAHPFWTIPEPETVLAMLDSFRESGIDGVECFYVTHAASRWRCSPTAATSSTCL